MRRESLEMKFESCLRDLRAIFIIVADKVLTDKNYGGSTMNIVKIFKSIVLGCLSALAAIVVEFLFMFNDDGIIEIDPARLHYSYFRRYFSL